MSRQRTHAPQPAPAPASDITITLSNLQIGDLSLLERFGTKDYSQTELVDFLDRCVVGGAATLPLTRLNEVIDAIYAQIDAGRNPKN